MEKLVPRPFFWAYFLSFPVLSATAHAQLFVDYSPTTDSGRSYEVGEYTTSGAAVDPELIGGMYNYSTMVAEDDELFVSSVGEGSIGAYTTSGATINSQLITGVEGTAMAVQDNDLFVANFSEQTIGEYTTSGQVMNSDLISWTIDSSIAPIALAVDGSDLFVITETLYVPMDYNIAEYDLSGNLVNASLISDSSEPQALAIDGNDLFVANVAGTIGEYTTSGGVINASLIVDRTTTSFISLAIDGNDLFVGTYFGNVNEYTVTGATVQDSLIKEPADVTSIVVVPEPTSLGMIALTSGGLLLRRRRECWDVC